MLTLHEYLLLSSKILKITNQEIDFLKHCTVTENYNYRDILLLFICNYNYEFPNKELFVDNIHKDCILFRIFYDFIIYYFL